MGGCGLVPKMERRVSLAGRKKCSKLRERMSIYLQGRKE